MKKAGLIILIASSLLAMQPRPRNLDSDEIFGKKFNSPASKNGNYALVCQNSEYTYDKGMENYIYSPLITVPNSASVTADFYVRGAISDPDEYPEVDYWGFEVSPDGGGTWFYGSNPDGSATGDNYVYTDLPDEWSSFNESYSVPVNISSYAGKTIQLRWYLHSDDDTPAGEGLWIDDVTVSADGTAIFYADFENQSQIGWLTEDATDIGAKWHSTTTGAYAGSSWAMNDENDGGYLNAWYQTLDSPEIQLPVSASATVTFMTNYSVEDPAGAAYPYTGWDGMNLRISADGGLTWDIITNVSPQYNVSSLYSFGFQHGEGSGIPGWGGSSNGWTSVTATLDPTYAGKTVRIRWAFASDPGWCVLDDASLFGWLIDDINIAGIFTNDGTPAEGWTASSQVPVGGDLWHIAYSAELPAPFGLTASAGDGKATLRWNNPVTGTESTIQYDSNDWSLYLNDAQPYAVVFDVQQDNSILKEGKAAFYGSSAFIGTFSMLVYDVSPAGEIGDTLYLVKNLVPDNTNLITAVNLQASGLTFSAGDKFAIGISDFAVADQGVLAEADTVTAPYSGRSFCGGPDWIAVNEAYNEAGNLGIRAVLIEPGDGLIPDSYQLYRRQAGVSSQLVADNITGTEFTDDNLSNNVTYYYSVLAEYEGYGISDRTAEVSVTPLSSSLYHLAYDDSTAETGYNIGTGEYSAVRFSPQALPALLNKAVFYSNGSNSGNYILYVWSDNAGQPGNILLQRDVTAQSGWNEADVSAAEITVTSGDIWIGLQEEGGCPPIGLDTGSNSGRSNWYDSALKLWSPLSELGFYGNIMIQAWFSAPLTSIESEQSIVVREFQLLPNYPNPFNPVTHITYTIPESGHIQLSVITSTGRKVLTLVDGYCESGQHTVAFDGSRLPSGVYIYVLTGSGRTISRKMVLLK